MSIAGPSLLNTESYRQLVRLMQARDWPQALRYVDGLLAAHPQQPQLLLHRAQVLLALGRSADARVSAAVAQAHAGGDALLLDAIGTLYSFANDQTSALAAYTQAVARAPGNPQLLFNRATVLRFHGELAAAEADYDRVIALRPGDFEAYKNRSDLRTQTPARNHVAELEGLTARGFPDWHGYVQIHYALAKEYEDLGDYGRSFDNLERAAARRRRHLQYDVGGDVATVAWIMEAFASPSTVTPAGRCSDASPIFIVGLPRSGTTLVDRILGSHSQVTSAGELNDLALAIVAAVQNLQSQTSPLSRRELVARSADIDFAALGVEYLRRAGAAVGAAEAAAGAETAVTGRRTAGSATFTDKMPLNYLYCGLIRRALPRARIVHLTRHPMAACYAMYKTLFKDAYPFSYALDDLASYYLAYRRLMDHWHAVLPGAILDVSYERLVADQAGETRRLLSFCGLEWENGCLDFHRNPAATTTASAAQVRQPLYDSSVGQWRHYERQLAALSTRLASAGIVFPQSLEVT